MARSKLFLLTLVAVQLLSVVKSFSLNRWSTKIGHNVEYHFPHCSVSNDQIEVLQEDSALKAKKDEKNLESLIFGGTYRYKSKQYSLSCTTKELEKNFFDFFNDERIQELLLSGGKDSTIQPINDNELTSEMILKWYEQAEFLGIDKPDPSVDSVAIVTLKGVEILTVKVIPTTTIGAKVTTRATTIDEVLLPEYQGIMIEDQPKAIGPKFFTWLFNKMIYGGDPDEITNKNESNRNESVLLKVHIDTKEMKDGDISFNFVAESYMRLEFLFPKLLLRFFPLKKEKAEKLCSDAILKALKTTMQPTMDSFCEEFEISFQCSRQ